MLREVGILLLRMNGENALAYLKRLERRAQSLEDLYRIARQQLFVEIKSIRTGIETANEHTTSTPSAPIVRTPIKVKGEINAMKISNRELRGELNTLTYELHTIRKQVLIFIY